MPKQLVQFDEPNEALPRYLRAQMDIIGGGFVMVITGGTKIKSGTGKSWTAARIGELMDKDFSSVKICSLQSDFLQQQSEIKKSRKPYQVLIMDEAGIAVSSKRWQSINNQLIGYSAQIARDLKCIIIFITPNFALLDKTIRLLVAYWGYCVKFRDSTGKTQVVLRFYQANTNLFTGQVYFSKIRMWDRKNKKVVVIRGFKVNKIDPKLALEYEEKSTNFKDGMRDGFYKEALSFEASSNMQGDPVFNFKNKAKEAYDNPTVQQHLAEKGKINDAIVRMVLPEISNSRAQTIARMVTLWYGAGGYGK